MALNFDFSPQLMLNLGRDELFFVENLKSHNELRPLLSGKVNVAELTSTHRLAYLKVIDAPVFGSELSWLLILVRHYFNLLIINIFFIFDLDNGRLLHF